MNDLDNNFTKAIITKLRERLNRKLTEVEMKVFSAPRSCLAYEMILDTISDEKKTQQEIENYVRTVIKEWN